MDSFLDREVSACRLYKLKQKTWLNTNDEESLVGWVRRKNNLLKCMGQGLTGTLAGCKGNVQHTELDSPSRGHIPKESFKRICTSQTDLFYLSNNAGICT